MAEEKRVSLNGRRLFVAIPAHDGRLNIKTSFALCQFMVEAASLGIKVYLSDLSNCSIITMARNALVHEFLKTDATELLFIDSDVVVNPDAILRLMAQSGGKDVTAGAYPRRAKDKKFFTDVYYNSAGDVEFESSLMRVERVGTGFMLIQRHVIETLVKNHPEWTYENTVTGEKMSAVFDFQIVNGKYVGEDYLFCDRVRAEGFKVYIDVEISLPHVGSETFSSDFYEEAVKPLLDSIYASRLKVVNG